MRTKATPLLAHYPAKMLSLQRAGTNRDKDTAGRPEIQINRKSMMRKGLTLFAALLTLMGCNSQKKNETADEAKAPKCLVVYYSQTGATQKVAQEFATQLNADLLRLEVEQPYDGTYQQTIERCQKEMAAHEVPALKALNTDFAQYDVIFLGYPIWFGTYAQPIASLVKQIDFAGKKLVPFCTFGSGGLAASAGHLKEALPQADIQPGYGIRNARVDKAPAEVERFLKENGYLKGKVEKLPDYSPQQAVTPEEAEIFNAACGDYQYPLGTPVTVGKRETARGTDYRFGAQSQDAQGHNIQSVIYVTVSNEPGTKPEFTEVVR